jgi:hypothetical protein
LNSALRRVKCHAADVGHLLIPGRAFAMALDSTAQLLGHKIPGRRNATYTKHFLAGVLVADAILGSASRRMRFKANVYTSMPMVCAALASASGARSQ